MRHYQIMGNGCMPYFIGLQQCPQQVMFNFPKALVLEAMKLANNFNQQKYNYLLNQVFNYAKENLSTKALAKYIINI